MSVDKRIYEGRLKGKKIGGRITAVIFINLMMGVGPAGAIIVGQTDNFNGGGALNWTVGTGALRPEVLQMPDKGPGGMGDGFLRVRQPRKFHAATHNSV